MPLPAKIDIQGTPVSRKLFNAYRSGKYGIYVLEGGSRSSKTRSIIDFIIAYCLEFLDQSKRILIARKKATWVKSSVMYDFIEVLKIYGIYSDKDFNKSDRIYRLYGNEIWFGGLDDPQKIHGFQTDLFWINEAIEAMNDDLDQLEMRTRGFGILDYNPTESEHWIYDKVLKRADCKYIHSTILDNPFAPLNAIKTILRYEDTPNNQAAGTVNDAKWKIYGLGHRAKLEGQVYTNYEFTSQEEIPPYVTSRWCGVDWGFTNSVTAIVEVGVSGNELWVNEICYKSQMLIASIVGVMRTLPAHSFVADNEDPRMIVECQNAGINIQPIGRKDIKPGIAVIQEFKIHVTAGSDNIRKELKNYIYLVDKYTGKLTNNPIDDENHALDCIRYVGLNYLSTPGIGNKRTLNDFATYFH